MLHSNPDLFRQIILRASQSTGIKPAIIEKDYYVTAFLKEIVKLQQNIVFKGGTSLSKCYKLIDRFSEDIDLNIDTENGPTEGQRRRLKESIVAVIENFGFVLTNPDNVRSRRSYNKYIVDYPTVFDGEYLKENLIVETSVYIRAYPTNQMTASSIIYDFLLEHGYEKLISQYDLAPFELNVQSAERTLVDKVFALGDYYLDDKITEHSRHIYDLYKLLNVVQLTDELKALVAEVRAERSGHAACLSAQEGVDIQALLKQIVDEAAYKADYENITMALLFEKVDYATAIKALTKIIESGIFVLV